MSDYRDLELSATERTLNHAPAPTKNKHLRTAVVAVLVIAALLGAFFIGKHNGNSSSGSGGGDKPSKRAPTILVSFDGMRASYIWERGNQTHLPNFWEFRDNQHAVVAERMIPQTPSLTFPNHYTLVTGLYPEAHGIVANHIFDPSTGHQFVYTNPKTHLSEWWKGTPLWVLAQQFGLKAGTVFWVGSEAEIQGMRPNKWLPYNEDMPHEERVKTLFEWIDAGECDLCLLYFSAVDTTGHRRGPDSPEVAEKVKEMDGLVGLINDGLRQRGLYDSANLVLVSDHGMSAVEHYVYLEDYLDISAAARISFQENGPWLDMWTEPKEEGVDHALVQQVLANMTKAEHITCYKKEDIPDHFHYKNTQRIPPIVCMLEEGWITSARDTSSPWHMPVALKGVHGYDTSSPSMSAIFMARAPTLFDSGKKGSAGLLPQLSNVNVYSVVARMLNISPAPNNGTMIDFVPFLKK